MRKKTRWIPLNTPNSNKDIELTWTSIIKIVGLLLLVSAVRVVCQGQISSFQHVVIIFQENRTPDNLFQGLCGTNGSLCPVPYDIWQSGTDNLGHNVPLIPISLASPWAPAHRHQNFLKLCRLNSTTNQCRMNGLPSTNCAISECPFAYVPPSEVTPYTTLAQQYGWANYMFQTNQGPSPSAHAIIFSGTPAPSAADDEAAIFVSEWQNVFGCLTPLNAVYNFISPQTAPNEYTEINNPLGTFCFSHDSMATLLDQHVPPLSWKYYTPSALSIWDAVSWFEDLCQPDSTYTTCTSAEWKNDVDVHPADVLTDIGNCNLRNVIWVIPTVQNSDHVAKGKGSTGGPSWVASIVNAIGQSACKDTVNGQALTYWQDTAIFITWDDWGGWYDHEPPTLLSKPNEGQGDYQYGFRVPLVVVSAYTPTGYIDNNRHDFGSILRFVEQNFGIPEGALNFADQRATTDLTEFFKLGQSPRKFAPISAPLKADFFLNDARPDEPPDDD
jgi:phospholipase C